MFGNIDRQTEVFFLPHCITDHDLVVHSKKNHIEYFYHTGDVAAIRCAKNELVFGAIILSLAVILAAVILT